MRKTEIMGKRHNKVVFKAYHQHQLSLLPPSLDDLIPANHPVRVVDGVVEQVDISPLLRAYKGGGNSSYHPKMLLKVLIYGYLKNIYSSRKLEEQLQESIHFMWLGGMATPDHSTINEFRGVRLADSIKVIFGEVVMLLAEAGLVDIKETYTDGTKIEANANRYTFVWGKSIKTNKERMKKQLESLWAYVEEVYKKEAEELPEKPDFTEISAEKVSQAVQEINEALKKKEVDKKVKDKLKYAENTWPNKLKEYEEKEQILDGRNSYSKTDHDATFMRMKEDHMKNGQLKPGYNVQASSSDKIVVNYSIGQTTADTSLYIKHMESYEALYSSYPQSDTADAGYGSQENYQFLEEHGVDAYVKYPNFHREQKPSFQKDIHNKENLYYNEEQDCYYCPMGQKMSKISTSKQQTTSGFIQTVSSYQARNCENCPLRGMCHQSKGNRIVQRNANLERSKEKARRLLTSERGREKRGQRCVDIEGTFAQLKHNKHFKRFLLRGLDKVNIELGLVFTSMNIARGISKIVSSKGDSMLKIKDLSQFMTFMAQKSA